MQVKEQLKRDLRLKWWTVMGSNFQTKTKKTRDITDSVLWASRVSQFLPFRRPTFLLGVMMTDIAILLLRYPGLK